MKKKRVFIVACLVLFLCNVLHSQNKYVGASKCQMCHMAKGKQYPSWIDSKHSKSYETLKTKVAFDIAKGKNIADPTTDPKCLKCHTTASTIDVSLNGGITNNEGVSCETCHGPGSKYRSPAIMKNRNECIKNGLIIPDEKLCLKCHNPESPTYKSFDYPTYNASIIHLDPQ